MDIVFDFDGVLCEYVGWRGHDNIGKPIKKTLELIHEFYELGYTLKLSTTRLNPYPFGEDKKPDELVLSGGVKKIISNWLEKQGVLECFEELTGYKPYGDIYIDDRGYYYNPNEYISGWGIKDRIELIQNQIDEKSEVLE